jgi:hypothetical protein
MPSTKLATVFLFRSSKPSVTWALLGLGMRLAQDVGAHRKEAYGEKNSLRDELWRRAFW